MEIDKKWLRKTLFFAVAFTDPQSKNEPEIQADLSSLRASVEW